jgi:hypothetical protein
MVTPAGKATDIIPFVGAELTTAEMVAAPVPLALVEVSENVYVVPAVKKAAVG